MLPDPLTFPQHFKEKWSCFIISDDVRQDLSNFVDDKIVPHSWVDHVFCWFSAWVFSVEQNIEGHCCYLVYGVIEGFWRLINAPLLPCLLLLAPSLKIGYLLLTRNHLWNDFAHFLVGNRGIFGLHLKIQTCRFYCTDLTELRRSIAQRKYCI